MNLFTVIENLRGENLASAILRYLIINSPEIRREVLRLIYVKSPIGPVVSDSHFSCYLEEPTVDDDNGDQSRGRIDIVLELDNAIVGIEAKFHASFQQDQPFKYFRMLEERANDLRTLRRTHEYDYFMCILVPESRLDEVRRGIITAPSKWDDKKSRCIAISWSEIRDALTEAEKGVSAEILYFSKMFRRFLANKLSLFEDWKMKRPHLLNRWRPKGTALHREILGDLYQLIDVDLSEIARSRYSSGKQWAIQTIEVIGANDVPHYLWYGFCPQGLVSGNKGDGAEFFIVSTVQPIAELDSPAITAKGEDHSFKKWREGVCLGWYVDIEKIDGSPESWSQVLNPFIDALKACRNDPTEHQ